MSALITLMIDTANSSKEVFEYLSTRFPGGVDNHEDLGQRTSQESGWHFDHWNVSPTVWLKLSNRSTGNMPPDYFSIAFELLDWLDGDTLLTFDSEGILARRANKLVVNPMTFTNPHSYLDMLRNREFVFANSLPSLSDLRFIPFICETET